MKLETDQDANQFVWAAKALAIVSAYNAIGAFDRMRKGPVKPAELGIAPRALATTLPVLRHIGIVGGDDSQLTLTEAGRNLVDGGNMPTARNLDWLTDLGRMVDVLKNDGPVRGADGKSKATTGGTRADDPQHTKTFLDMLYRISGSAAESVFTALSPKLPKKAAVLDVGGGHGRYARHFADAGHATTLLDLPPVVEYAKGRHGDALGYLAGDFNALESVGGPYDLVIVSNILHGESDEANAKLVARCAAALRPGGRLAIKDMFIDEMGRDPANAVFFGVTMLFYTNAGRSPTLSRTHSWFDAAGLVRDQVIQLDTSVLVVGAKPS